MTLLEQAIRRAKFASYPVKPSAKPVVIEEPTVEPPPVVVAEEPTKSWSDLLSPELEVPIICISKIEQIKRLVCIYYNITKEEIEGESKITKFVVPRHVAVYLCRTINKSSYPAIGRRFGYSDHTSSINACEKVEARRKRDVEFDKTVCQLEAELT